MGAVVVFVPKTLVRDEPKYLRGYVVQECLCPAFYVLGSSDSIQSAIGCCNAPRLVGARDWITLSVINAQLHVMDIFVNGQETDLDKVHVVQFDEDLASSELILPSADNDHLKWLVVHVKNSNACQSQFHPIIVSLLAFFVSLNSSVVSVLSRAWVVTKFTTIGQHLKDSARCNAWLLRKLQTDQKVTLETGNYLLAILVDVFGGFCTTYFLAELSSNEEVLDEIAYETENLLELIKGTIKWLMGSPAGLKLNYPLNYILGNFFLYNIYLWWTFLGMVRPVLETGFCALLHLGFLGISFQISILADIYSLASFHLYCIYIYAARLYELQIHGILSLSRIFLGRKKNPEPGKVDSCPYTTEQLFVGTVCFTVLLFLLPTTLVYYVVFTLVRLGSIFVGGLLTRARYALQIIPVYSTLMWLFNPKLVTTTMKLCPVSDEGSVTIIAEPIVSSWLDTIAKCVPSIVAKPMAVNWKEIIHHVFTGKLIYPF